MSATRVAILVAASSVALASVPAAPAAPPKRIGGSTSPLTIVTVPRLAGIRFQSAGQTFATDRSGVARVELPAGAHKLRLVDVAVERNGVRSRFSRWGDDSFEPSRKLDLRRPVRLEVGFEQAVRVDFAFVDRSNRTVDPYRVTAITLTSTIGSRETFRPSEPRWLLAGRVARRFHGLEETRIQYAIQRAVYDGSNVVHKAQQRFFPAENRHMVVHLLLFSARLGAHDLLFGFRVGTKLDLVYPDGRKLSFPLHGRPLELRSLPRGTYGIKIHAWGYSPAVPLALSRDQVIELRVISYLDMAVMLFAAVAVTAFLVLVRRPHLRRRVAGAFRRNRGGSDGAPRPGGANGIQPVAASPAGPPRASDTTSEAPSRPVWSSSGAGLRSPEEPSTVDLRTGGDGREIVAAELCANGHELTDENLYIRPGSDKRECRVCRRERRAAQRRIPSA
jgi:hypothetical protein